jgi:aminopeptidase YwaD
MACDVVGGGVNGRWTGRAAGLLLVLTGGSALSQSAGWTVKPEWVRAHEEFLASDAMQGRGSATHDEEVAAAYVASEFIAYGLQPAPGMNGYVQAAPIASGKLDGHAVLSAGSYKGEEGQAFTLLQSSGSSSSGPLVKIKAADVASGHFDRGSVVLITGADAGHSSMDVMRALQRASVTMLLPADESTAQMYTMFGGSTRLPVRLAEDRRGRTSASILAINTQALGELEKLPDGTPVALTVTQAMNEKPRATYNAVGYLPGTDPKAGTLLLTAHLDHLGVGRPVNGDAIYNGANDDAAGTTAVMELAHALASGPRLRRSVLFVCFGSEEAGDLGSTYFGSHPPVPLKDLVTNLEFEMIGNQDPKMPKGVLLLTGWERSNLGPTLKAHGALLGPDPYPEEHFFERSDNYALALKGVVAHTAAGWGTPPTYHKPDDDLAHLDLPFMTAAIQSLVEPLRWLASSDFVPQWNAGGKPEPRQR